MGGVQPVCVPYFYRIRPPRFLCASPRHGLEPCVRASFQNEKRDIVVVVPEVLANFSTFSNVIVVKFLLWFLGTIFPDFLESFISFSHFFVP